MRVPSMPRPHRDKRFFPGTAAPEFRFRVAPRDSIPLGCLHKKKTAHVCEELALSQLLEYPPDLLVVMSQQLKTCEFPPIKTPGFSCFADALAPKSLPWKSLRRLPRNRGNVTLLAHLSLPTRRAPWLSKHNSACHELLQNVTLDREVFPPPLSYR